MTGGPRPFGEKTLDASYVEAAGSPPLVITQNAFDNTKFVYQTPAGCDIDSAQLNKHVLRFKADAAVRHADPNFSFLKGYLPVPLLMTHTTGDAATPFSIMQDMRRRADASGYGDFLVQRAIRAPGHGGYERDEVLTPFNALFDWAEKGIKPEGDDVLGDLSDAGTRFTTERPTD